MQNNTIHGREVIIEFRVLGAVVRVSAMDVETLTEISIQGPATAPEEMLKRHALRRLDYVLKKKGILT